MPETEADPETVSEQPGEVAGEESAGSEPKPEPAHGGGDRVYFLIADATEGPMAPIDPDVVARRAARAMERLLKDTETASVARPAARSRGRRARRASS